MFQSNAFLILEFTVDKELKLIPKELKTNDVGVIL